MSAARNPLAMPNLLPDGIRCRRDDLWTDEFGMPATRIMLVRDSDRMGVSFVVPRHKTVGYVRIGLFRHKAIEVIDYVRIEREMADKARDAFRLLLDAPVAAGGRSG